MVMVSCQLEVVVCVSWHVGVLLPLQLGVKRPDVAVGHENAE